MEKKKLNSIPEPAYDTVVCVIGSLQYTFDLVERLQIRTLVSLVAKSKWLQWCRVTRSPPVQHYTV